MCLGNQFVWFLLWSAEIRKKRLLTKMKRLIAKWKLLSYLLKLFWLAITLTLFNVSTYVLPFLATLLYCSPPDFINNQVLMRFVVKVETDKQ
jgi:hypothetical protein